MRENAWKIVSLTEDWMIILGFLFGLYAFKMGFSNVIKIKSKMIDIVKFNESTLEVIYDDGSNRICDLSQVKKHTLKDHYSKGKLVFRDGFVLENLERVSYWPILRKKILLRLQSCIL